MTRLLYAGVVGPLLFIVVFLIEGFTRPGYSQWRNFVSQLSTGETGWVQVINFLVFGTLLLAFAAGLRNSLRGDRAAIGAPVLFALVGIAILMAGIFTTDPAVGYPPGRATVQTTTGLIHGLAGLATFTLLPAGAFVMAWHFAAQPRSRNWVIYSVVVGAVVLAGFVLSLAASEMDRSGSWPNAPTGIFQRIAIVAGLTWISAVAWSLIRKEDVKVRSRG